MVKHKIEHIPLVNEKGSIIDVISWRDLFDASPVKPRVAYPNQVVIMAGGKGTRLDPFTRVLPKPLIPIGEKPIIEIIMEKFYTHGFSRFVYTLNYKKEYIQIFLREIRSPFTIEWIEEEDFLGTAGSLSLLKEKLNDTFFVTNCDTLLEVDFADVLRWHKRERAALTIIGCHREVKMPFGLVELKAGRLKRIVEKPIYDVTINTGVYVMEPSVTKFIPPKKPMDMNTLIEKVARKKKVSVYLVSDGWLDVGEWGEYKKSLKGLGLAKDTRA